MEILPTRIPGVLRLAPRLFGDERGYFCEPYNEAHHHEAGIGDRFVMDGESLSRRGTIRGLHFRDPPEAKLVRCVRGAIFDVVVDLRPRSPTFGQWEGHELSETNHQQIYVPRGFAHGFSVLTDEALMLYKKTELYDPLKERGLAYDDPDVGVDWKILPETLSERDRQHPKLRALFPDFR